MGRAPLQRDGQAAASRRARRARGRRVVAPERDASATAAGPTAVSVLSLAELRRRLELPASGERFSPLTGEGVLVVDVAAGREPEVAARRALRARLLELPGPTIARIGGGRVADPLLDAFDVLVTSETELERVVGAVGRSPLASLALVQLLRRDARAARPVHEALLDESLVYSTLQSGREFAAWLAGHPRGRPRPPQEEPAVRVARVGPVLELTLNRPEKRNAFSAEMRDALCEALEIAACDSTLTRIELRGEGPSFCSGGDLDEFGTLPDPATAHAIRSTRHAARLLAGCGDRVTAHVHGSCIGAGMELPAFCARVVAAPDAHFRLPEVAMGLVPGAGGTLSVPRRIGRQRATWLALTGESIDAETALRWGLVDEMLP